jgi:hypothetical protein
MNLMECPKEASVIAALAAGSMADELATHVNTCPVCRDAKLVWSYLAASAAASAEAEIAPAETIWWRAQIAKKRAAAHRSIAWIQTMQKIALAIAALAVVAIGAGQASKLVQVPLVVLAGSAAVVVLFLATVLFVVVSDRGHTLRRGM